MRGRQGRQQRGCSRAASPPSTSDGSVLDQVLITDATLNAVEITPLALLGATPITTGFAIECRAGDGADGVSVQDVRLIGVKIG